jgi:hypothetical protein
MSDVLLSVGLTDPDRSGEELLEACLRSLSDSGAEAERTSRPYTGGPMLRLGTYPALNPRGGSVEVRVGHDLEGELRSLIHFWVPIDPERDGDGPSGVWHRFREAAVRLAGDVRPLVAVWGDKAVTSELDFSPDMFAAHMYWEGWVDPARFDAARRAQLDAALSGGPRGEWAGGWRWSPAKLEDDPSEITPGEARAARARSEAVWEAITGRPRSELDEWHEQARSRHAGSLRPRLMVWAADRDDEQLLGDVRDWAAANGFEPDLVDLRSDVGGPPGWLPAQVRLGRDDGGQVWLDALRSAVAQIKPSWGALKLGNDVGIPGMDPNHPTIGRLENVWVRDDWIGDRLGDLNRYLDGSYRETWSGGRLFVTGPDLVPGGRLAEWCSDRDTLQNHLSKAAAVLGLAARASRPD